MCPLQDPNIILLGGLKTYIKYSRKVLDIKDSLSTKMQHALLLLFWSAIQAELSVMAAPIALEVHESNSVLDIEISVEEEPLQRVNNYGCGKFSFRLKTIGNLPFELTSMFAFSMKDCRPTGITRT